jgi:cobalt-precorrin-5B (C1)-methyltransferase
MRKKLRSGYTTGACAAAASKAATLLLLKSLVEAESKSEANRSEAAGAVHLDKLEVDIPFPDGRRVAFPVYESGYDRERMSAWASVKKDAGDDPDITNKAVIVAEVSLPGLAELATSASHTGGINRIILKGGKGVGVVTKPGLSIPAGEPAINPVPRKMIRDAVSEAIEAAKAVEVVKAVVITIIVPRGEELAKKTLNGRLGIVGGISILGTTGIVKPVSAEAWTATITATMDVAKAMNQNTIVLSSGRTSEKAHQKIFDYSEDCYAMMGDYLEFSLLEAKRHDFGRIHICAQGAKLIKAAMSVPQTHVRHGTVDPGKAVVFLKELGVDIPNDIRFNTVREIFNDIINRTDRRSANDKTACELPGVDDNKTALTIVCNASKRYAEKVSDGVPVTVYLVSYEGEIIAQSG